MSNKAMTWAVEAKVKGSHKLVLMLLAEAHNGHTGACFPSQEWIEEKSGLADSTVAACIKELEDWGFLTRHTKALGRGKGSRRDFELHLHILDPQILEVQNTGFRPLKNRPLDLQIPGGPYKEEPELNRKEPERGGAKPELDPTLKAIWDAAPQPSRERSSKKRLAEAVAKVLKARKDISAEQILAAWMAFLRTPDARKEQGRFCPGIHVWLNDNRFDAFLQPADIAAKSSPEDERRLNLERCFYQYGSGGAWRGREFGFPVRPDEPEAAGLYPDDLYTKYRVQRPQGAAA